MTSMLANLRPADVPAFPRETLQGECSFCPVCLQNVFPDNASETAHYLREHRGVVPTSEQVAAAEAKADEFAQLHAADLARAASRRAARRAS